MFICIIETQINETHVKHPNEVFSVLRLKTRDSKEHYMCTFHKQTINAIIAKGGKAMMEI